MVPGWTPWWTMAGFFDKARGHYIADFRGLYQVGKQRRRVRLPAKVTTKAQADGWAKACDRVCRLLEVNVSGEAVREALGLGAITPEQGAELLDGRGSGAAKPQKGDRLTVVDAALSHPSSRRDPLDRQVIYDGFVRAFCAHAGITYLDELTVDHVQDWIAAMQRQKLAWDTRRHRLMYLRRACRMAAANGLPDVLAGLRLDRRGNERPPPVITWGLEDLLAGIGGLGDLRAQVVVILGGLMGLRPSETWRVAVGDIEGAVLQVGRSEAKNASSRRALPIPRALRPYLDELAAGRPATAALLATYRGTAFDYSAAVNLFRDPIGQACGRVLPLKTLRKSFATWTIRSGQDLDLVEAWMGHRSSRVALITQRHYLEAIQTEQLKPLADAIDEAIVGAVCGFQRRAAQAAADARRAQADGDLSAAAAGQVLAADSARLARLWMGVATGGCYKSHKISN